MKKDYYIMCNMTWAVLSSFHYIFEKEIDSRATDRMQSWARERERFANWLMDEAGNVSNETAYKLDKKLEQKGDEVTFYASQKIHESVRTSAYGFSVDEVRLYLYMSWLKRILDEFSKFEYKNIAQFSDISSPEILKKLLHALIQEMGNMEQSSADLDQSTHQIIQSMFDFWQIRLMSI